MGAIEIIRIPEALRPTALVAGGTLSSLVATARISRRAPGLSESISTRAFLDGLLLPGSFWAE
jgi:hypothetical protein